MHQKRPPPPEQGLEDYVHNLPWGLRTRLSAASEGVRNQRNAEKVLEERLPGEQKGKDEGVWGGQQGKTSPVTLSGGKKRK